MFKTYYYQNPTNTVKYESFISSLQINFNLNEVKNNNGRFLENDDMIVWLKNKSIELSVFNHKRSLEMKIDSLYCEEVN